MSDIKIEAARRMVVDQVLGSAHANETESSAIREAQERAEVLEHAAHLKRQVAAMLAGDAAHPTSDQVQHNGEDLGMTVGILRLALPEDPSIETLEKYRDLTERLFEVALTQMNRVKDRLKEMQATQATGRLPEEFLPQPDPLTAAPEDSGPHAIQPASPWPDLIGQRLALDIGETEPMIGRLTGVDPERLTVQVDEGTHAGEAVRVDIAGVADWQALPEPQVSSAAAWEPAGYPERPAVEAPPLPRRERKADYVPTPLGQAAAEACGRVLEALTADEPEDERLIDPDCRDGKCSSCVGGPCQHECHRAQVGGGVPCPECLAPMPGDHNPGCPQAARVAAALDAQFGTGAQDEPEEAAATGRFQPETGAGADRAGAVDSGRPAGPDGTAPGTARGTAAHGDMTVTEQNGGHQ